MDKAKTDKGPFEKGEEANWRPGEIWSAKDETQNRGVKGSIKEKAETAQHKARQTPHDFVAEKQAVPRSGPAVTLVA